MRSNNKRYMASQVEFIKCGFKIWLIPELTLFFNAWFEMDKTPPQIRAVINNRRFTCGRPTGNVTGVLRSYTKEQAEFIKVGYQSMNHRALAKAFNDRFGTKKTPSQMKYFTTNHKIKSSRTGHFEKGHKPWNNGTKGQGLTGSNKGSFKKGHRPANLTPLGTERICSKDGYVLIKVAEPNPYNGQPTRYRHKHVVIWEEVNGPVPPNHVVVFVDGNKRNITIENLELISRSELVRLNQLGYAETPKEFKPTIRVIAKIRMKAGDLRSKQKESQE